MEKRIMKYNPAFLTEDELMASFVVRLPELELILETIRHNTRASNQHILVIGPRGIGKTMLVLRVAMEVRRDKTLSENWYPIVFGEESYTVCSPGEFWLEALFHLKEQSHDKRWQLAHENLNQEHDEIRLRERALAALMDFADEEKKRLLLIVENMNMLFADQLSEDDAWIIRHTMLNEPRLMLLGSATSRFDEVDQADKAMYELFKLQEIKPLTNEESQEMWHSITGEKPSMARIRPIQILTGGNPRLLSIIANFAAKTSFEKLIRDLTQLVDEHTEYFKSYLDGLAPLERKIFVTLTDMWDPATSREVAEAARVNINKTSSNLIRLQDRGAVVVVDKKGRKKWYQVAERMYNIYHLMRRRGNPTNRVRAIVNFMVHFYEEEDLVNTLVSIAEEAIKLEKEKRFDHLIAYETILNELETPEIRVKIFRETPEPFFKIPDLPISIKQIFDGQRAVPVKGEYQTEEEVKEQVLTKAQIEELLDNESLDASRLIDLGNSLLEDLDLVHDAEKAYRRAIEIDKGNAQTWVKLGELLHEKLQRYKEAEEAYRKAIEINPGYVLALTKLGYLLHEKLERYDEAEDAYRQAIERDKENTWVWTLLGLLLHEKLERYEEAEDAYRKAIEVNPKYDWAWAHLGQLLHEKLDRYDEAEVAYRKAIEINPKYHWVWAKLGQLFHEKLERYEEAETVYRKAIEIYPDYAWGWGQLGLLCHEKLEWYEEAERAYLKADEKRPGFVWPWLQLGELYQEKLERYEDAKVAYQKVLKLEPDFSGAWIQLGLLFHENLGQYEDAERAYRKATEIDSEDSYSWELLGRLLHKKLERYEEAETAYRKALEIDSENSYSWVLLGQLLHEKLERYEEAEKAYLKADEKRPGFEWPWVQLGELYYEKLGNYEKAEASYQKVIKIDPDSALAWSKLGQLYHEKFERYDEAEAAYRKALEVDSDYAWGWGQLGLLYHEKSERYEEAEEAYRKAIEINPKYDWAWVKLGQLLQERLERFEEAEEAYRKALEIDPEFAFAWDLLGQLLHEKLERYEEAEDAYQKSLDFFPKDYKIWEQLFKLQMEEMNDPKAVLESAQKYLEISELSPDSLLNVMSTFNENNWGELYAEIEIWLKGAFEKNSDDWPYQVLLALYLGSIKKWKEADITVKVLFNDEKQITEIVGEVTEFIIRAASGGYAKEAIRLINGTPAYQILEPLVVGLKIYLKEDTKVAQEIYEVGLDVAKKIEIARK